MVIEYKISSIPLIILLLILLVGCVYYLWVYRFELKHFLRILIKRNKIAVHLKDKSNEELKELLLTNKSLEHFEKCAEIRDELDRRRVLEP
jgi:cell division protein FtsL